MLNKDDLWDKLKFYFDSNDGSLPELRISNLTETESKEIFDMLLGKGDKLSDDQSVWVVDKDVKCNDFDKTEDLHKALLEDSRHILINNIKMITTTIPPIGLFVYEGEIEIDYRMGEGWNKDTLYDFFELLKEVRKLSPASIIEMPLDGEAPFSESDIKKLNTLIQGQLA